MKKDVFATELSKFKDDKIRQSAENVLEMIPDYFYDIPASSSGNYHPLYALGEHGLVRHVKAAMRILEEMFRDSVFGEYDEHTQDLMRMALLLHDGFKSGLEYSGDTVREHPVLMSNFIKENKDKLFISDEDAEFVSGLILSHMGPWNTDKDGNVIMPKPATPEQRLIHECDYFASRNFLEVFFDEKGEIDDSVDRGKVFSLNMSARNKQGNK